MTLTFYTTKTLTRRGIVAGVASVALIRRVCASTTDVDIVVVGAGAAGLAAAKQIKAAGQSVIVLEARPRIGGRAFTDTSLGAPFDAGAEFIHWAERNPMKRHADEWGVPLKDDDTGGGRFMVLRDGQPLSEAERARRRSGFNEVDRYITPMGGADKSFAEAVRGAPDGVAEAAAGITRMALGEEPDRVSIQDYDQLLSGDDYVVPSGYGALVTRLGADVPVRLNTPATHIRWDNAGVAVETLRGALRAKAAIVTVPVGVLKSGGLRFTPDLPAAAQAALDGLHMGALTKIALRIDRAQWGDLDTFDFFDVGPSGAVTSVDFWPHGRNLAIAALGGDHARGLCEAGERAAVDFATERLVSAFGARARVRSSLGGSLAGGPIRSRAAPTPSPIPATRRHARRSRPYRRPHLAYGRGDRGWRGHDGRRRLPGRGARGASGAQDRVRVSSTKPPCAAARYLRRMIQTPFLIHTFPAVL